MRLGVVGVAPPLRLQTGTQGTQPGSDAMEGQGNPEHATVGELVGDVGLVAAPQGKRELIRDLGKDKATLGATMMKREG